MGGGHCLISRGAVLSDIRDGELVRDSKWSTYPHTTPHHTTPHHTTPHHTTPHHTTPHHTTPHHTTSVLLIPWGSESYDGVQQGCETAARSDGPKTNCGLTTATPNEPPAPPDLSCWCVAAAASSRRWSPPQQRVRWPPSPRRAAGAYWPPPSSCRMPPHPPPHQRRQCCGTSQQRSTAPRYSYRYTAPRLWRPRCKLIYQSLDCSSCAAVGMF
jgi:hypothetical protein